MPWVNFTDAAVKARLSERELQVYESAAQKAYPAGGGAAEDPDPPAPKLPAIVTQVLASFRGIIRANPNLTFIGDPGTLPDFCIEAAAIIARVGLLGLNPVAEGETNPRAEEYRAALKFRDKLSSLPAAPFLEEETAAEAASDTPSYGGKDLLEF